MARHENVSLRWIKVMEYWNMNEVIFCVALFSGYESSLESSTLWFGSGWPWCLHRAGPVLRVGTTGQRRCCQRCAGRACRACRRLQIGRCSGWSSEDVLQRWWMLVWLVVTGCHEFGIFPLILGCCPHPNWRTPSFFRGVGILAHQLVVVYNIVT